jgi:hypothetical protein
MVNRKSSYRVTVERSRKCLVTVERSRKGLVTVCVAGEMYLSGSQLIFLLGCILLFVSAAAYHNNEKQPAAFR